MGPAAIHDTDPARRGLGDTASVNISPSQYDVTAAYHKKGMSSLSRAAGPYEPTPSGAPSPSLKNKSAPSPSHAKKRQVDFKSTSSFRSNSISIRDPGEIYRNKKIDKEVYK